MKSKNKYSKQNIYSNQKFEDQIWYNQQIIDIFKFFTTSIKCFPSKIKWKHFPGNQSKFFFDWNVFSVDWKVFSVQNKMKTLSWKSIQIFLWLERVFRWPESVFYWPTFLIEKKYRKVWKIIFQKSLSGKQTYHK